MSNFDDWPWLWVKPQPLPAGHPDRDDWATDYEALVLMRCQLHEHHDGVPVRTIYDSVVEDLGVDPEGTHA